MSKNGYSNIRSGTIMDLTKTLKALSHINRIRILNLLNRRELCVCELENIMELNQSNVSRHLSKLKEADLIIGEKKAQWIYYQINEKLFHKHIFLKKLVDKELDNLSKCKEDLDKLNKYQKSGLSCEDLTSNKTI